jgi:uncharacterized membrane protein YkvA (DUF1232 family)
MKTLANLFSEKDEGKKNPNIEQYVKNSIQEELLKDIQKTYDDLKNRVKKSDFPKLLENSKQKIDSLIHDSELDDEIIDGLKIGYELIETIKDKKNSDLEKKYSAAAALNYLVDSWDIVPDFIQNKGLMDDIYILYLAKTEIDNFDSDSESKDIKSHSIEINEKEKIVRNLFNELGGGLGPHLAKRAKELDLLDKYQRKALFSIGEHYIHKKILSDKQISFFANLLVRLLENGLTKHKCPNSCCKFCDKIEELFKSPHYSYLDSN